MIFIFMCVPFVTLNIFNSLVLVNTSLPFSPSILSQNAGAWINTIQQNKSIRTSENFSTMAFVKAAAVESEICIFFLKLQEM